jgi:hypothetical protein
LAKLQRIIVRDGHEAPARADWRFAMSPQVDAILQQIESLDEADRLLLEQRLGELMETAWRREAESARAIARERGIDQRTIDVAVEAMRYGS